MAMSKTRRHNRKPKPDHEAAPAMTIAEYYRIRLTRVPIDTTPPTWEDYLRASTPNQPVNVALR